VDRNRLKRRLRELARIELLPALASQPPLDVAIRARVEAYRATFDGLRQDVLAIRTRLTGEEAVG